MEEISHPIFGALQWDPQFSEWTAYVPIALENQLTVHIDPDDTDRSIAITRAAELFKRVMDAERGILLAAVQQELLEVYNDCWRNDDEPELTIEQLIDQLEFGLLELRVSPDAKYPFTLWYSPKRDELFGGHDVALVLNPMMHIHMIDLRG